MVLIRGIEPLANLRDPAPDRPWPGNDPGSRPTLHLRKTITFRNPIRAETLNTNPNVLHQSLEIFIAKNKNNANCVRAGKKLSILNVSLGCIGPILYTRPGDPSPQQGGQSLLRRTTPDPGSRFGPNNPSLTRSIVYKFAVSNFYLRFVKRMRIWRTWMDELLWTLIQIFWQKDLFKVGKINGFENLGIYLRCFEKRMTLWHVLRFKENKSTQEYIPVREKPTDALEFSFSKDWKFSRSREA